eukprot:5391405-Amphidinium_carterae.1
MDIFENCAIAELQKGRVHVHLNVRHKKATNATMLFLFCLRDNQPRPGEPGETIVIMTNLVPILLERRAKKGTA